MKTKILIVDNVPAQQSLLENMLKQIGYENILKTRNAKDAMFAIEKEPDIRLVLTEWDLPDKSGLDLLGLIKANDKLNKIPVILAFRAKPKEDILKAHQAGVACFLIKPYKLEAVRNKISNFVKAEDGQSKLKGNIPNLANLDLKEI